MQRELINLYQTCFPEKDASAEIKALGDDFNFDILDDKSFIIFRMVSDEEMEIIDMGTLPEARGQGLATQLLNSTIEDLKDIDIQTVYLEVAENNADALKLYQNCGFVKYNTRKGYYSVKGKKIDAILMKKSI